MIVLIGGEKGGTGKTTIATHLAAMRTKEKGDLILVDADPQPHSSYWCSLRDTRAAEAEVPRVNSVQKLGNALRPEVLSLRDKYADIVIDSGGRDTPELRAALTVADIAILPIQASQFDIWTLGKLNDLIGEIKAVNENLKTILVFNRASPNPSLEYEVKNAKTTIADAEFAHLIVSQSVICERAIFRKVAAMGLIVDEGEINKKAEEEITGLYKEVYYV